MKKAVTGMNRQKWGSKLGVIMAVAGSAVGLGNFLRFPGQAASNGGGAFMIPYFIALVLLGIPLMWIEWTVGRFGGVLGHGTAPGMFHEMTRNRFIKYFGIIGIFGPVVIFIYYTYIESWLLGYAFFTLKGDLMAAARQGEESVRAFLAGYQGVQQNAYFRDLWPAFSFFVITFFLNMIVIYGGVRGGIERLAKFAMPTLLIMAVIIAVRVITLGTPDPTLPERSFLNGLGFLWNPDFSKLGDVSVWLAASGQIFFTLSVGIGVILTYASYLSKGDDVTLSGLSAVSTNEFAEVILGGTIIIPAAFIFLGGEAVSKVVNSLFDLGFVTMPLILAKLPFGTFFAFLWFMLLFLAGLTSSVSLIQPAVSFMEDEFSLNRVKTVWIIGFLTFFLCLPGILWLKYGVVDELDFWGGTFGLVLFATIEAIVFGWVFGIENAWDELHAGSDLRIPRIFKFIMKYVTPTYLLVLLSIWFYQKFWGVIIMKGVPAANRPYILFTRLLLLGVLVGLAVLVKLAWHPERQAAKKARKGIPT